MPIVPLEHDVSPSEEDRDPCVTYHRNGLASVPAPFDRLVEDTQPFTRLGFTDAMSALLAQAQGLAGVCYGASTSEDTAQQDLTRALYTLDQYLQSARCLLRRWQDQQRAPGPCTPRPAATEPDVSPQA